MPPVRRQPSSSSHTYSTRAPTYVNISSTRRGHVFSAGDPNSRRSPAPSPSSPVVVPPRHPHEQILEDPFRTRSATHKGSRPFIRTLLYSLHNIVPTHPPPFPLPPSLPPTLLHHRRGRNTRCHAPWYCVYLPTPTHCSRETIDSEIRRPSRRKPRDFLV